MATVAVDCDDWVLTTFAVDCDCDWVLPSFAFDCDD